MTDIGIISLGTNRQLTSWFIDQDPTSVVFTPHHQEWTGGAKKMVSDPDRSAQIVKIIYPGGDGIVIEEDHTSRRFDFIVVAEYDADIDLWDSFDHLANHYVVEYVFPYNGYEVKVGGSSHGSEPDYG